ncbi:MAG: 2-hydroxyacyl-CoA dehydratase [Pirellulales bacterium]|nr:2-hydroxyacyl-CoA dehydratase [Pirellulales bacterium]
MNNVGYCSPFVPPEWIAAFGWSPRWLRPRAAGARDLATTHRGLCPFAGALVEQVIASEDLHAVVLTTACDPMRYGAAVLQARTDWPTFLFNLPSTWQSNAAGRLYCDELRRLGRFLVDLGGRSPSPDETRATFARYDAARGSVRDAWPVQSSRQYAEMVAAVRGEGRAHPRPSTVENATDGVPLALLGGPLVEEDLAILDALPQLGGRIVLDASEGGQRTLAAALPAEWPGDDPVEALRRAYFDAIPDVFRRPNDRLFEWLRPRLAARGARGILLRRHVFCDLWHAEIERIRQATGLPLIDLDMLHADAGAPAQAIGRIEAFLEMLRGGRWLVARG